MPRIIETLYDLKHLEDLAHQDTPVHRIHPLIKLLVTLGFIVAVISMGRYEITKLLPFTFYPAVIISLAELPGREILKKMLLVEPFIIGIGILNPILDTEPVMFANIALSRGWITFLSILIKSTLTVSAGILLVATSGMDQLASALRMLKVPKIFVLQLLLTYRYISLLMEELARMTRAYALRAPGHSGVKPEAWGSFAGQLLLRTYDRAQRIYAAMVLRGFAGEYPMGGAMRINTRDGVYFILWSLFFMMGSIYNVPQILGAIFTGVMHK